MLVEKYDNYRHLRNAALFIYSIGIFLYDVWLLYMDRPMVMAYAKDRMADVNPLAVLAVLYGIGAVLTGELAWGFRHRGRWWAPTAFAVVFAIQTCWFAWLSFSS